MWKGIHIFMALKILLFDMFVLKRTLLWVNLRNKMPNRTSVMFGNNFLYLVYVPSLGVSPQSSLYLLKQSRWKKIMISLWILTRRHSRLGFCLCKFSVTCFISTFLGFYCVIHQSYAWSRIQLPVSFIIVLTMILQKYIFRKHTLHIHTPNQTKTCLSLNYKSSTFLLWKIWKI